MPMGHRPMRRRETKLVRMTAHTDTLRAYVLEDDPDIAALEADLLREMGFGVVTCSRIVELGDLMDVALPHLLIIDVMLPDGDGGDITELLRTAWPGADGRPWVPHLTLAPRLHLDSAAAALAALEPVDRAAGSTRMAVGLRWWDPETGSVRTVAGQTGGV